MKVCEKDFFMGLCFFLSVQSNDKTPQSCVITKGRKLISSSFSNIDLLGSPEGTAEKSAISLACCSLKDCSVYIDHTPTPSSLNDFLASGVKKVTYFETDPLSTADAFLLPISIYRFDGNLNWIRDFVSSLKSSGVFVF